MAELSKTTQISHNLSNSLPWAVIACFCSKFVTSFTELDILEHERRALNYEIGLKLAFEFLHKKNVHVAVKILQNKENI